MLAFLFLFESPAYLGKFDRLGVYRTPEKIIPQNNGTPIKSYPAEFNVSLEGSRISATVKVPCEMEDTDYTFSGWAVASLYPEDKEGVISVAVVDKELQGYGLGRVLTGLLCAKAPEGYRIRASGVFSPQGKAMGHKMAKEGLAYYDRETGEWYLDSEKAKQEFL
jgi:hypothetical protein